MNQEGHMVTRSLVLLLIAQLYFCPHVSNTVHANDGRLVSLKLCSPSVGADGSSQCFSTGGSQSSFDWLAALRAVSPKFF